MTLLLALAALAPAQDEEEDEAAEAARSEALARKLLTEWQAREYRLGEAGVSKASCTIVARQREASTGITLAATGAFSWKPGQAELAWDNPRLGPILDRQGWSARDLQDRFEARGWLAGEEVQLSARREERTVAVTVEGRGEPAKTLFFDDGGVLRGLTLRVGVPPRKVTLRFRYDEVGDKLLLSGWDALSGTYVEETEITFREVDGCKVYDEVEVSGTVDGQEHVRRTLRFQDWKLEKAED